jgi:hypothetical protein
MTASGLVLPDRRSARASRAPHRRAQQVQVQPTGPICNPKTGHAARRAAAIGFMIVGAASDQQTGAR